MTDTFVNQHGGKHYQADYQHWDWATDIGMLYLVGTATKYLPRWKTKGGVDDLIKVRTYLEKIVKCWNILYPDTVDPPSNVYDLTEKFIRSNNLGDVEAHICRLLQNLYKDEVGEKPKRALEFIELLISEVQGSSA
jgi:hypothetical protein